MYCASAGSKRPRQRRSSCRCPAAEKRPLPKPQGPNKDMAVLCARRPHVCSYKYGSVPLPNKYCHEFALRMILHMISTTASRYGKVIEPQLSLTVDFYVRLFIRIKDSPLGCHSSILKYSSVYQCIDCESFYLQPIGREITEVHKKDKTTG